MEKQATIIRKEDTIAEIVSNDFHTADIFLKYGIEFCCGGKLPLEQVCASRNIRLE